MEKKICPTCKKLRTNDGLNFPNGPDKCIGCMYPDTPLGKTMLGINDVTKNIIIVNKK